MLLAWMACSLGLAAAPLHPNIWVQPATAQDIPGEVPEIPWHDAEPSLWSHAPLAHLSEGPNDPNALIWVAMTQQFFYLHVVVADVHHINDQTGDAIWNSDAIQVSIDPRGAGKTLERQDPQVLQLGSLNASFALTRHGVRGWAHKRSTPDAPGPLSTPTRIERDQGRGTTTYDIALPWSQLHCTPGESATLGLQVQIHDRDAMGTLRRAIFGDSPDGTFDPTRFKTLRLGSPAHPLLMLAPQRLDVWRPIDAACVMVISNLQTSLRADVQFADTHATLSWQNSSTGLRRWNVCVAPRHLMDAPAPWSVHVQAQGLPQSARGTYISNSPGLAVESELSAIGALASSASHALARRHLETTHALLQSVWAAALTTLDDGDAAALDAAAAIARCRSHLPPQAETLERNLQSGERPLLAAFISSEDQTLQPYTLTLPRTIDANQAQPVMVFLHGKGNPSLGQFVADAQASHHAPWEHAYLVNPWGRGNIAYRGFAETDVLDAWTHANSLFHFDRERVYLGGFSMGGTGAWQVAVHHPDIWAALAIFAGTPESIPIGIGFGGNIAHLPVYLHHGTTDGAVDISGAHRMQDELEKNGGKPTLVLEPNGGHAMTEQHQSALRQWLTPAQRLRPTTVRYVSDKAGQTAYGITLRHDPQLAAFPRFVAHMDGRQLRIDTTGTTGINIDLRNRVWNFADTCRVVWNGTEVYDGPPKTVRLGRGAT